MKTNEEVEAAVDKSYTEKMNASYTKIAKGYDLFIKALPIWRNWIAKALPHIQGPRVLEVSFGTGYLMTKYANRFETFGIDYNAKMVEIAAQNLEKAGYNADLRQGNVEDLPFDNDYFNGIINTMAFTGYPDAGKAMSEMFRVLKPGGKLVMVDISYPKSGNPLGNFLTRFWIAAGDIVRDMDAIFREFDFDYTTEEIGGFGSVHLTVAKKRA